MIVLTVRRRCGIMGRVMEMDDKEQLPERKRNRLQHYDYSSCGAYFITICTKDRKNIFWDMKQPNIVGEAISLPPSPKLSSYGQIAEDAIQAIPKHYLRVEVDRYVIMPNHIHLILLIPYDGGRLIASPTDDTKPTISTIVGQMKRYVSKEIGMSVWQRSFHDHVIRNRDDYDEICKYIYENPQKWKYDCFYTEE